MIHIGTRSKIFRASLADVAPKLCRNRVHPAAALILALGICCALIGCRGSDMLRPLAPGAVILAFGDSLTFGTGTAPDMGADPALAYPAILEGLIGFSVVNAGVPGEMSSQGLARLPRLLKLHQPALVILCHGGNDLLHGGQRQLLADNLRAMISLCRDAGADVVLLAVPSPQIVLSNTNIYREAAKELNVPLDDDSLPRILADASLKSDLIHPNAKGYAQLAKSVAALLWRDGALH